MPFRLCADAQKRDPGRAEPLGPVDLEFKSSGKGPEQRLLCLPIGFVFLLFTIMINTGLAVCCRDFLSRIYFENQ